MYIPEWSIANSVAAAVSTIAIGVLVARELFPDTRLKYSKFNNNTSSSASRETYISSYNGMLLIYTPSLALSALFLMVSYKNYRMQFVSAAVFVHYLKRVLEVLFVHRYSGQCKLSDNILISLSYSLFSLLVYKLASNVPNPSSKAMLLGAIIFLVGEYINFYHHLILRDLRKDGSKEYKIPTGALFDYVWCPHYTGEIITFIAIVLLTQHFLLLILQVGSGAYLVMRAYNTRKWYEDRFDTIPQRACLIPCIF
ncbi:3-oxo-5-alpha-steroid 4-dehydrogenase-domain-containing protein [Parasitella parasitica]|nr:3-oxo-5-alpha-steroid 4-dehydrogenase-domain-containing protein [Parasitella parasitica]